MKNRIIKVSAVFSLAFVIGCSAVSLPVHAANFWTNGDMNGDGVISGSDYVTWQNQLFQNCNSLSDYLQLLYNAYESGTLSLTDYNYLLSQLVIQSASGNGSGSSIDYDQLAKEVHKYIFGIGSSSTIPAEFNELKTGVYNYLEVSNNHLLKLNEAVNLQLVRVDTIINKMNTVNSHLQAVSNYTSGTNDRLDSSNEKLDTVNGKLDTVINNQKTTNNKLSSIDSKLSAILGYLDDIQELIELIKCVLAFFILVIVIYFLYKLLTIFF